MIEDWRDIKGYEGVYQVSNLGNVRSLNYRNTGKVKLLIPKQQNRGYLHVLLYANGKGKAFLIHRLVADAFLPCSDVSLTVNHIDENLVNNRVDNLEWCSLKQNIGKYVINHPEMKRGRPEDTTPVRQLDMNGNVIRLWKSAAEVRRTLHYNTSSISQCCNRKRKSAYGFRWQFAI